MLPIKRIFQRNAFQHTFQDTELKPCPFTTKFPPTHYRARRFYSLFDHRTYNPFEKGYFLFSNFFYGARGFFIKAPVAAIHTEKTTAAPVPTIEERRKPIFLWGFVIFIVLLTGAIFALLYGFNKIKKAIDNLIVRRKKRVSIARLVAAALFGYLGTGWSMDLGVFYAPILWGSTVTPLLFGILGFILFSSIGILLTKYLNKGLVRFYAWLGGNVPRTNTGVDSISRTARAIAQENTQSNQGVGFYGEEVCAGIRRALLFRLKHNNPEASIIGEYYDRIKNGYDWHSPVIDEVFAMMYDVTLKRAEADKNDPSGTSTSAEELAILQSALTSSGEHRREIPTDVRVRFRSTP